MVRSMCHLRQQFAAASQVVARMALVAGPTPHPPRLRSGSRLATLATLATVTPDRRVRTDLGPT